MIIIVNAFSELREIMIISLVSLEVSMKAGNIPPLFRVILQMFAFVIIPRIIIYLEVLLLLSYCLSSLKSKRSFGYRNHNESYCWCRSISWRSPHDRKFLQNWRLVNVSMWPHSFIVTISYYLSRRRVFCSPKLSW